MITASEMIEAYVSDVAEFLPRKQRRDVAQELRALLTEEIDAAGGESREEAARKVLVGFGRPAEVAARYAPPATLIDPADTRRLIILALAGAALIALGAAFERATSPSAGQDTSLTILAWWGLLFAGFAFAAWLRRRPGRPAWKPHPLRSDKVNRLGLAAAIAFWVAGTVAIAAPHWVIDRLTGGRAVQPVYDVFVFDEDFARVRGPIVLGLMIFGLLIQMVLLVTGRWLPWLYTIDFIYGLVFCSVLTWVLLAGPAYRSALTDEAARGITALIVLFSLAQTAVSSRRHHVRQALGR